MTEKTPSRLMTELLEVAEALHWKGIMDDATYERITVRHLGAREAARRLAELERRCPQCAELSSPRQGETN